MMRARFSELLTLALAGLCGLLVLVVFALWLGMGRGYRWWPNDSDESAARPAVIERGQFKLSPWSTFAAVNERPPFNEDRRPTPLAPPEGPPGEQKPVPKLEVILSGIILTPKIKMAMVKEKGKQTSTTVKAGNALSGDLSVWTLVDVKARSATFRSIAGEEVVVELTPVPNSQRPVPPAAPQPSPPPPAPIPAPPILPPPAQADGKGNEQAATELQQRIEERRRQLREEAERSQQQHQ